MVARLVRFAVPTLAALALAPAAASAAGGSSGQWALRGDGPIGIASAWAQTTGGDAIVAIVDTGVDLGHPELVRNLWRNPGELPANGIDDDADGFVDDVNGVDLVNNDGDPDDDNGHGTHVAGIVAARGDDGGVAGVAWRARIMAVKVLDANGGGTMEGVARGIRYAVGHGARVINLSLVGPRSSTLIEQAIAEAQAAGVLIVAAAGNDRADDDATPAYPASLPAENLLAVTSMARDGRLAPTASWGRRSVDFAAPGEEILSTRRGGREELRSGSSMAAAHVSGALVLLTAARPDLGWRELAAALRDGARRTAIPVASGRLDVAGALRRVIPPASWRAGGRSAGAAPARSSSRAAKRMTTRQRARIRARMRAAAGQRRGRVAATRARIALVP